MTQKEIIKNLQGLKAIKPNEEFARISRSVILSSVGIPVTDTVKQGVFSRGISFALSVALTAMVIFVLTLGNTNKSLKNFFLPTLHGVNTESLISEADSITKDINIKLDEIKYFDETKRAVALADSSTLLDNPDALLEGEDEIDKLLEEIIKY